MKAKITLKSLLLLCALIVGGANSAWADDSTLSFTKACGGSGTSNDGLAWTVSSDASESTFDSTSGIHYGTTNATVEYVTLTTTNLYTKLSGKKITKIVVNARDAQSNASITVSVGSTSFTANKDNPSISNSSQNFTFDGEAIVGTTDQVIVDVRRSSEMKKAIYVKSVVITYETVSSSTPSITTSNVEIAHNATNGSIGYQLANATGNVSASVTSGDWLTLGTVTASAVPFTCSANEGVTPRTAQVKLSFTGATDKVVTVTQASAPYANIAALTANTVAKSYNVTLTNAVVTYVNGNYAYIQDASGAVVLYKSNHGLEAGNVLNGTATVAYQLKNSNPQITDISGVTPTSGDAQAPTAVAQSAWAYTFSDVLSQYVKITDATITTSNSKYYVSLGGETIQLYKASGSISSLDLNKKYNITGFPTLYNTTKEIQIFANPEVVVSPTITVTSSLAIPNYVVGTAEPTYETLTVNGSNLTADITLSLEESSSFELSADKENWSNVLTLAQSEGSITDKEVAVRLKAGLAIGNYEGTVTLSSTGATDKTVGLSGSVISATTYDITCVASPVAGGTLTSSPSSALEGATVTLNCTVANGYSLTSIVITKTEDGSATNITPTASENGYTFTMPAYAVTATATLLSENYEGIFAKYSGDLTEGDYILAEGGYAMSNSLSEKKFLVSEVGISNNTIANPSRSIVWHIAPSSTTGYWTIYNAVSNRYVYAKASGTEVGFTNEIDDDSKWSVNGTYDFRCKANDGEGTVRYLRKNNNSVSFGNYATGNGGPLTLYKYAELTESTITFNGNGGTYKNAATYTQTVYDGVESTLNANKFTRSGYAFAGWNTVSNGENGTAYDDEGTITVTDDITLYAQWSPLYTLTVDNNIDGGDVSVVGFIASAVEGTEITLTASPTTGYAFSAWNVHKEGDMETKVTVSNNTFIMPAYNVVVSATFKEAFTYTLVTDANQMVSGKHYIIVGKNANTIKAMGDQNNNNRAAVDVTESNSIIAETTGVCEFVICGPDANGYYSIYDEATAKYLYAVSSSNNYLKVHETNDAEGKWKIEIDNTGIATVKAQGSNTRNWMRFNSASTLFSCYGSGQDNIYLYVKDGDNPITTTASVKLNAYGYATFASTSALDFLDAEKADYSAWQITKISDTAIKFSQITSMVKAGTGILLKGTPDATINLNLLPAGGNNISSTNKLEGVTEAKTINANEYYALSGNQFVKVKAGNVPAGKALLPASAIPSSARQLTIVFDDETTGISAIESGQWIMDNVYDLQGRRVMKPTKGLYIVNGKKVVIK